jgi:hypothetical protein
MEHVAGRVVESANQVPRHGTKRNVVRAIWSANRNQDADLSGGRFRWFGLQCRFGMTAHEGTHGQRERQIASRIA